MSTAPARRAAPGRRDCALSRRRSRRVSGPGERRSGARVRATGWSAVPRSVGHRYSLFDLVRIKLDVEDAKPSRG